MLDYIFDRPDGSAVSDPVYKSKGCGQPGATFVCMNFFFGYVSGCFYVTHLLHQ